MAAYMMIVGLLLIGIIFLLGGADLLIRGAGSFAIRIGLPIVVIGLTIMGYGTGLPELIVSIQAGLEGRGDIALGNVIGSNIANIGLVLGISLLFRPIQIKHRLIHYDGPIMVAASILLSLLILSNESIGLLKGGILFLCLIVYTVWAIWHGKSRHVYTIEERKLKPKTTPSIWIDFIFIAAGFVILFLGGRFFLQGSIAVAKLFNLSDAVIGLTVVALGTSLPELATSLVAIIRKHGDIALGNIIGSCIFNIFAIVGLAGLISPIHIETIRWIDYTVMTLFAITLFLITKVRPNLTRVHGVIFLAGYISYMVYLLT